MPEFFNADRDVFMKIEDKKIYAKDLSDGDLLKDVFLVKKKQKGLSRSGSPYLTLILCDKSGDIEAKVWENADKYDELFDVKDFLLIKGRVTKYRGKLQITVHDLSMLDDDNVCLKDFIKASPLSPDKMIEDLREIYNQISCSRIRKLIFSFIEDKEFLKTFYKTPAATSVHHAYLGGLLEHVLSLSRLAVMMGQHYPVINRDILLAGVFFHDIGKTKEINVDRTFSYSDEGKLLGHISMGVEMVSQKAAGLKDFPRETLLLIKHMIMSHHGHLEYGSPKLPQTLEAVVLHFLDDMDAKINTISNLTGETGNESWSDYSKFLSREFYKGKFENLSPKTHTEKLIRKPAPKRKPKKSKKKSQSGELDLFD